MNSEETARVLEDALAAVDQAGISGELRPIAFEKAIDLLSGALSRSEADHRGGGAREHARGAGGDEATVRIASEFKVEPELVEEIFDEDNGELKVVVPVSRLATSKSGGSRELALLVAAARQATGTDDWTHAEVIREVVKDFGKFDPANFGKSLRAMDSVFRFTGSDTKVRVKVNRHGWAEAGALVRRLAGGETS